MAKWWVGAALVTGWLGAAVAPAGAEGPPTTPPPSPPAVSPPPADVLTPVPAPPATLTLPASPSPVAPGGPVFGVPAPGQPLPGALGVPVQAGFAPPPVGGLIPGDNGFAPPFPPSDASNAFTDCPQPCDVSQHLHFQIDYLRWFVQRRKVPLLATTGSLSDAVPGALGQPGTRNLIDEVSGSTGHSGGRFSASYDLDEAHVWAVDGSFFILEQNVASARVGGDGSPGSAVVTRPFFNVITGTEDADPVNLPGIMAGTMTVNMPQRLFGADANVRYRLLDSGLTGHRFTLLAGARYLALDEKMLIDENLTDVSGLGSAGNQFRLGENFTAYNRFYGAQVGADWEYYLGSFSIQAVTKVAFGSSEQSVRISGFTDVTMPDGSVATNPQAALLVGPGNVGRHTHNVFATVPEGQFNVGWMFNPNVALTVGYDVLYWSRVARPGDQTSRGVNVQPVGAPAPFLPLEPGFGQVRSSGLWVQGVSVGFQLHF